MSVQHPLWEKRLCVMDWLIRPIRAVFFADEQAFNWIQKRLGLSNYQMAALVWVKGLILSLIHI